MILTVPNCGAAGVNRDISRHDLPPNVWTDALDIRFQDGATRQALGYETIYTPSVVPLHLLPVQSGSTRYWIYAGTGKIYVAYMSGSTETHTNLTRSVGGDYTGAANAWTSCTLSGIPVLNPGNTTDPPQSWDLNVANKFGALTGWPASTYCKAMRTYKNFLIALNVTKSSTNYPFMVKWSSAAEPGALPTSWDATDVTKDAGETDLAEGGDYIVDGLQLRDSFVIYKERSVWRMDYVGGDFVFRFQKVIGSSGAMNRNCIAEFQGQHFVLTSDDVIVHDGQSPTSVLDHVTRRQLFAEMDTTNRSLAFVFRNPFYSELMVCYPSIGSSICDRAMVWNWRDKTVSFRSMPNVYHAATGPLDFSTSDSWAVSGAPWSAMDRAWGSGGTVPEYARVLLASSATKLYLLDAAASYAGSLPSAYVERVGLSFQDPTARKVIKRIRPRITGNDGATVTVSVGYHDDLYDTPTYTDMTYTIGETTSCDCLVNGRYLAVKFSTGTAYQWKLDSYDVEYEVRGRW